MSTTPSGRRRDWRSRRLVDSLSALIANFAGNPLHRLFPLEGSEAVWQPHGAAMVTATSEALLTRTLPRARMLALTLRGWPRSPLSPRQGAAMRLNDESEQDRRRRGLPIGVGA